MPPLVKSQISILPTQVPVAQSPADQHETTVGRLSLQTPALHWFCALHGSRPPVPAPGLSSQRPQSPVVPHARLVPVQAFVHSVPRGQAVPAFPLLTHVSVLPQRKPAAWFEKLQLSLASQVEVLQAVDAGQPVTLQPAQTPAPSHAPPSVT